MLDQKMTEREPPKEEQLHLFCCERPAQVQWIENLLRKEAADNDIGIMVHETKISTHDPRARLRMNAILNAHILQTLAKCFQLKSSVPTLRYVVVGTRPQTEIFPTPIPMMQVQTAKYGWKFCYLDANQATETIRTRISQIFKSKYERITSTMKETKSIITALNQAEDKSLSLKENMVRYCVQVEHYTEEEAVRVVDAIIKGTSEFTTSFDNIKGRTKADVAATLKDRLDARLKGLPQEDVDKILENLYIELMAFCSEQLAEIASEIGEEKMQEAIKSIRKNCSATLAGKSYDEKLDLIVAAVENCGSLTALTALAADEHSFSSARSLDDTIATATLNSSENLHVMDEYALIRTKNYTALAEYISAQHGNHRKYTAQTTPYEIGVASAANVESRKIRMAALAGMITFDNAMKLLASIAMIGLSLMLAYIAVYAAVGLCIGTLLAGYPFLAAALATGGVVLTYEGVRLVIRNKEKVGAVVAAPVIWIKNLAVRLFRGFCRIFHINLPENDFATNDVNDDADTQETEEAERNEASGVQTATNVTSTPHVNMNTTDPLTT